MTPHTFTPPPRLPGWPHRLNALVLRHQHTPFAWGVHDCLTWAADVALALHGTDTLHRGRPAVQPRSNARQAWRALKERGGPLGALGNGFITAGLPGVAVASAQVGDLLLVDTHPRWPALAVCNGDTALAPGRAGLVALPAWRAARAWRL
jgi:hypothetical protein